MSGCRALVLVATCAAVLLSVTLPAVASTSATHPSARAATRHQLRLLTRVANHKHACGFNRRQNHLGRALVTHIAYGRIVAWARGYFRNPGTDGCWIIFSLSAPLPSRPHGVWLPASWGSSPCENKSIPRRVCRALKLFHGR